MTALLVGMTFLLLIATGVLVAVALPHVRSEEKLADDGERLRRIARTSGARTRAAAEAVATRVGQSASSIGGARHDRG